MSVRKFQIAIKWLLLQILSVVGAVALQQVGKTGCEGYTLPLSCLATVVMGHSPSASLGTEGESGGRVKGCTVGGAGLWQ